MGHFAQWEESSTGRESKTSEAQEPIKYYFLTLIKFITMKKTIFILSLISFTGLTAQTRPIEIEVVDRTEITMLAAQYDVLMQQKRQEQAELNYDTANYNREIFASDLYRLYKSTTDKDILKRIKKAEKQNERLLNLYNRERYSTDFYRLQSVIRQISADIEKLKR